MELVIQSNGDITTIYSEILDLTELGIQRIERASNVEPDEQGHWWAEIINGPRLGPFNRRSDALAAEVAWLLRHRLGIVTAQ